MEIQDSEANFQEFSQRFSSAAMILAGFKPVDELSLQLMPSYIRRNWATGDDEKDLLALGGALRYKYSGRFGMVIEYFYVFSDIRQEMQKNLYSNPLSAGLEIYTGGHIFTINLSNSTGIIPNTFIPYTGSEWDEGEFRLGFTISRLFKVGKDKKAE